MGAQDRKQSTPCLAASGLGKAGAIGILASRCDNGASAVRAHGPAEGELSSFGSREVIHMPHIKELLI